MEKETNHAFNKDLYLLGVDDDGVKYWLEAPEWQCGWYWAFGYIETYTNNNDPSRVRDINSHEHWDSKITGKHEHYDHEKGCFVLDRDYVHHINEFKGFKDTTLTDSEAWEVADLMQSFYTLRKTAEYYRHGGSHISSPQNSDECKDSELEKRINEVDLPKIFKRVVEIFTVPALQEATP